MARVRADIFAELVNAGSGYALPGFERTAFRTMSDVDGERLPLRWGKGGNNTGATVPPAHRGVRGRRVFAVKLPDHYFYRCKFFLRIKQD